MRVALVLLAVLALFASPVIAAAAQAQCGYAPRSALMAGMDMPTEAGGDHSSLQKTGGDPCCDPSGHHKPSDKSCAQACATTCTVAMALPSVPLTVVFVSVPAVQALAPLVAAYRNESSRLKRPPKSIT
jgi:hypothetical protein